MFLTFFFVQSPRKVCIANRNIEQKFVFLLYEARHLRRWDQSTVSTLNRRDPGNEVGVASPRGRQFSRARACFVCFTVPRKNVRQGLLVYVGLYISWKQHCLGQKIGKEMLTNYTPRDRLSVEFSISDSAHLSPLSDVGRRTECTLYLSRRVHPLLVQMIKALHIAID